MTRINTIDVSLLADQHLFAEYREITRISKLAKPLRFYGTYTMGTGHMKFFYNKGAFLEKRLQDLYVECIKRGINATHKVYTRHPTGLNNDWVPAYADHCTNVTRLVEKLSDKPAFYKYYGKPVASDFYSRLFVALQTA